MPSLSSARWRWSSSERCPCSGIDEMSVMTPHVLGKEHRSYGQLPIHVIHQTAKEMVVYCKQEQPAPRRLSAEGKSCSIFVMSLESQNGSHSLVEYYRAKETAG